MEFTLQGPRNLAESNAEDPGEQTGNGIGRIGPATAVNLAANERAAFEA